MNLFYLDENLDKCAEYHVDKHIVKMPLEVAQILCTSIWIDQFLGFIPRALNKEERDVLNAEKAKIKHLPLASSKQITRASKYAKSRLYTVRIGYARRS